MSAAAAAWGSASEIPDLAGAVAIAGVGEADHSQASGRSEREISVQAVERALADAGLAPRDVDGILYSGGFGDAFDAKAFHAHFGTRHEIWESPRGGATVWAATAPAAAAEALRAGKARFVLNTFSVSWATQRPQMVGGPGQFHAEERYKASLEIPFGWFPQPVYFATIARRHMIEFGTRPEQLGAIAVSARRHANLHPGAVMREKKLSLADYLARPMLVDPLRVEDCCLISDGGGAYLMTTPERARDLRPPPVLAAGVGEGRSGTGLYWSQQSAFTSTPQVFSAPAAFEMAGIRPREVDVLALYDPFTIVALMQIEDMGFCVKGEGAVYRERRARLRRRGVPSTRMGVCSPRLRARHSHVIELVASCGRGVGPVPTPDRRLRATPDHASTLV